MYKDLINKSESSTENLISLTEQRLAVSFPTAFREFCLTYNGAKFKDAEIKARSSKLGQTSYQLRDFWKIEKIGAVEIEHWDANLVIFAEDIGGNYFVFHKSDMDCVYFLDHETNDKELVSDSFEEFLSKIVKLSYDDIPKPQNASGWINPAFLKRQKDLGNA